MKKTTIIVLVLIVCFILAGRLVAKKYRSGINEAKRSCIDQCGAGLAECIWSFQ